MDRTTEAPAQQVHGGVEEGELPMRRQTKKRSKQESLAGLLQLEAARADDATRQMNEAVRLGKGMEELWNEARSELKACRRLHLMAVDDRRSLEIACELNMAEYLKADEALKVELLANQFMRAEMERLKADLAHSDADRRQLQRDVEAQKKVLDRWGRFDCVSPALRVSHAE